MTSAGWTQHRGELDQVVGHVTLTVPPAANCTDGPSTGEGGVLLILDGKSVATGNGFTQDVTSDKRETRWISEPIYDGFLWGNPERVPGPWTFEPTANTAHSVEVEVYDNCGRNGGHTGEHFKVESVSIDVIGVR